MNPIYHYDFILNELDTINLFVTLDRAVDKANKEVIDNIGVLKEVEIEWLEAHRNYLFNLATKVRNSCKNGHFVFELSGFEATNLGSMIQDAVVEQMELVLDITVMALKEGIHGSDVGNLPEIKIQKANVAYMQEFHVKMKYT